MTHPVSQPARARFSSIAASFVAAWGCAAPAFAKDIASSSTPNAFTNVRNRVPWQIKLTDDDFKPIQPTLMIDFIERDCPFVDFVDSLGPVAELT